MNDATRYYVRHNVELGEATRECDCRQPCQKVVKAEDYDLLQSRLGAALNRAEIAEARLRNVIGWRENDWPEGFDRRTAELVAELASPPAETVAARRSGAAK